MSSTKRKALPGGKPSKKARLQTEPVPMNDNASESGFNGLSDSDDGGVKLGAGGAAAKNGPAKDPELQSAKLKSKGRWKTMHEPTLDLLGKPLTLVLQGKVRESRMQSRDN
jgi:hypothetical protein